MCNLYRLKKAAREARTLFDFLDEPEYPPREYVAPLQPIGIIRHENGVRRFALVRWGLIPSWVKVVQSGRPLTNARLETILEKPSFRHSIRRRRCLIPADGYYEWRGDVPGKKTPYLMHRPDNELFVFAGIWDHWLGADGSELETAAIITMAPNAALAQIHDRMPSIIQPEDHAAWLDILNVDGEAAVELIKPVPDDYFAYEPTKMERKVPPRPNTQMSMF
jgi:putative SOS response-associated peptidase YedK